jgi:uncharacterized membrane protein
MDRGPAAHHLPPLHHRRHHRDPTGTGDTRDDDVDNRHIISPLDAYSANLVNCFIHLHRAEMTAMVAYRVRMDTSTNWAVSMTSACVTVACASVAVWLSTTR